VAGIQIFRPLKLGLLVLLAPVGMLVGHALTYLIVLPDPVERAGELAASGHVWLEFAVPAAVVLATAAAIVLTVGYLRRPSDDGRFRRELAAWLGPRLAACQLGLFFAVETAERLVAGHALSAGIYHEVVEHGALGQLLVALTITGLCWCLALFLDVACARIARPRGLPMAGHVAIGYRQPYHDRGQARSFAARAPPLPC
jgi:hypothetical protein